MPNAQEMTQRVREFAVAVEAYVAAPLPTPEDRHAAQQLQRAAHTLADGYESERRGSRAALAANLTAVVQEAEDCCFWIRMLIELAPRPSPTLASLAKQAEEIFKALARSRTTARHRCRPAKA